MPREITESDIKPDFGSINFYTPEISSMHLENPNIYMTDKQLGQLASYIIRNYWCKYAKQRSNFSFGKQISNIKDLLINYRTEQVLAGIYYYLVIKKQKIHSIGYLKYGDILERALAYYRVESLKPDSEYSKMKREKELEALMEFKAEEEQKQQIETERISGMSEEEWVKQEFLNKFKRKG